MNQRVQGLIAQCETKNGELQGLLSQSEALTAEQDAQATELEGELAALEIQINAESEKSGRLQKVQQRADWLNRPVNALAPVAPMVAATSLPAIPGQPMQAAPRTSVPAMPARMGGKASVFSPYYHEGLGREVSAAEGAYRFGMWAMASLFGSPKAIRFCQEQGLNIRAAATEGINTAGGVLVVDEFENALIDLREQYGVFRKFARYKKMNSDTLYVPRRTGGLTPYFVGENTAITESQKGWDRVGLVAKKLAVLAKFSSELDEDAVIDIGNDLAKEIAYAFSLREDECGFAGDGTSTYGGITGVRPRFLNLTATRADIAGLVVGTGNLYSELTLSDFEAVVGRLPQYADTPNARWFCHRSFYWNVMVRLMLASGGVTEAEISKQGRNIPFLGYPVEVSQVLPSVEANDQVCAIFGDLALAAMFGDRRMTTIALSEHLNFAEDELAIRGTERFDINVHDVGNSSATASLRVPGPIVALATAAS